MTLAKLRAFDISRATPTIWVVKKSGGAKGAAPIFTARWVDTDKKLDEKLKEAAVAARNGIEEIRAYDLLAQNNEGSALTIGTDETHAGLVVAACGGRLRTARHARAKIWLTAPSTPSSWLPEAKSCLPSARLTVHGAPRGRSAR